MSESKVLGCICDLTNFEIFPACVIHGNPEIAKQLLEHLSVDEIFSDEQLFTDLFSPFADEESLT